MLGDDVGHRGAKKTKGGVSDTAGPDTTSADWNQAMLAPVRERGGWFFRTEEHRLGTRHHHGRQQTAPFETGRRERRSPQDLGRNAVRRQTRLPTGRTMPQHAPQTRLSREWLSVGSQPSTRHSTCYVLDTDKGCQPGMCHRGLLGEHNCLANGCTWLLSTVPQAAQKAMIAMSTFSVVLTLKSGYGLFFVFSCFEDGHGTPNTNSYLTRQTKIKCKDKGSCFSKHARDTPNKNKMQRQGLVFL